MYVIVQCTCTHIDAFTAARQLLMGRCYLMLIVRIIWSPLELHVPHMVYCVHGWSATKMNNTFVGETGGK